MVVGRIGSGQGVAGSSHALTVGGHLVREAGDDAGRGDGDRIPGEGGDYSAGNGGGVVTVVGLVGGRESGDLDRERGHVQRAGDHRGTREVRAGDDERGRIDAEAVSAHAQVAANTEERVGRDDREGHGAVAAQDAVVEGVGHAHAGERYESGGAVKVLDALDTRVRGGAVDHGLIGDAYQDSVGRDDGEIARDVVHRVVLGRETRSRQDSGVGARPVDA